MDCSPHKSIEVKINGVIISLRILSVVAKVNRSVGIIMSIPMCFFEKLLGNVAFSPMFKDDIGFIGSRHAEV